MSAGFDIRFTHSPVRFSSIVDELDAANAARLVAQGRIQVGEHSESFVSPLDAWSQDDYQAQWMDARNRLRNGVEKSCFVVSVDPPHFNSAIEIWGVWRLVDHFRIQNLHLLPCDERLQDVRHPYAALRAYTNLTKDGDLIHDWSLPLDTAW